MRQVVRLPSPALVVSALALFVALGGTVYAAEKLSGKSIRVKSLPGNRLEIGSVPANRLKPSVLRGLGGQAGGGLITGREIDLLSLGQVPDAAHSEVAEFAKAAGDAQTAVNAVNAVDASTVNGHSAGCMPGTREFAGACWQSSQSQTAVGAAAAAASCAAQGGTLPEALQLSAFAQEPGVILDSGSEWSGDLTNMTGPDEYAAVTVSQSGTVSFAASTKSHKFRCVIPLVT